MQGDEYAIASARKKIVQEKQQEQMINGFE